MADRSNIPPSSADVGEIAASLAAADAALGVALDMFARAVREGGSPELTAEHAPVLTQIGGRAQALARLSESVLLALVIPSEAPAGGAGG